MSPLDRKYGKVETPGLNAATWPDPDEPVFLIRAKDAVSVPAILSYAQEAWNLNASDQFIQDVFATVKRFTDWQAKNEVKVPD